MNKPLMTQPEPFLVMAIRELLSGPPAEAALWPEYFEKIKVLTDHPGTLRLAHDIMEDSSDEDSPTG